VCTLAPPSAGAFSTSATRFAEVRRLRGALLAGGPRTDHDEIERLSASTHAVIHIRTFRCVRQGRLARTRS